MSNDKEIFEGKFGDTKKVLIEELNSFLKPYKNEYDKIVKDKSFVEKTLLEGSEKALSISEPIIKEVKIRIIIIFIFCKPWFLNIISSSFSKKFKKINWVDIKNINGKISNSVEGRFSKVNNIG